MSKNWRFGKEWEEKIREICREEIRKHFEDVTKEYLKNLSGHIDELERKNEEAKP